MDKRTTSIGQKQFEFYEYLSTYTKLNFVLNNWNKNYRKFIICRTYY